MFLKKALLSILILLHSFSWASSPKENTYAEQDAWKKLQMRLPENYRLNLNNQPQEYFWIGNQFFLEILILA